MSADNSRHYLCLAASLLLATANAATAKSVDIALAPTTSAPTTPTTPATSAEGNQDKTVESSLNWKKHTFLDITLDYPADAELEENIEQSKFSAVSPDGSLILAIFETNISEEEKKADLAKLSHSFFDNAYPPKSENHKLLGEKAITVSGDEAYEITGSYVLYEKAMVSRAVVVRKADRVVFLIFAYLENKTDAAAAKMQHILASFDFKPGAGDPQKIQAALKTVCSQEAVAKAMASGMTPISARKWSFERPTDWELRQKPDNSAIAMATMKGISCIVLGDCTIPEINNIPDAEGAFALLKGESKAYADTLKKVKEEPLTINGCRAYRIEATAVDTGVDMTKEITMVRAGPKFEDVAFVVYQAPTVVFKDLQPMAAKVVASLKYTGEASK